MARPLYMGMRLDLLTCGWEIFDFRCLEVSGMAVITCRRDSYMVSNHGNV